MSTELKHAMLWRCNVCVNPARHRHRQGSRKLFVDNNFDDALRAALKLYPPTATACTFGSPDGSRFDRRRLMGYFRPGKPGARHTGHPALRRLTQQPPMRGGEPSGEDGRVHMDAAFLRLLTQLANCGLDAYAPPLLRIQQHA
jgi:hypothetical protein